MTLCPPERGIASSSRSLVAKKGPGFSSNAPRKIWVGRILWFRIDRFSVPCPRVIVITALPEDMPYLSENDVPMNVPNGTKLSRMFFVEYDFAQLVAGLFHHGVLFWSAFADSGFNSIRTLPIYQQLQGCLTHVGGG